MVSHLNQLAPSLPEVSGSRGQLIGGVYHLEEVIGRGSMGTVWKARDRRMGRDVAIKLVAREHLRSAEALERFRREARAVMRLKSRFAVEVYEHGSTDDDIPFTAMELLVGETLEARIEREGPLPVPHAVRFLVQVSRALSRAHKLGIIHRDLKPANVFLVDAHDALPVARVLDFGIAKVLDDEVSTTQTGAVLGTPEFMSPEQVRGLPTIDKRSDLYSLGMVTFNALIGRPAFEGQAFGDLLLSICTKDLPIPTKLRPELPEALDRWFAKACAREPEARFQRAQDFAAALHAAAGLSGNVQQHLDVPPDSFPRGTFSAPPAPMDDDPPTIPLNPVPRFASYPPLPAFDLDEPDSSIDLGAAALRAPSTSPDLAALIDEEDDAPDL